MQIVETGRVVNIVYGCKRIFRKQGAKFMKVVRGSAAVLLCAAAVVAGWLTLASAGNAEPFAEVSVPDRIEAENYDDGVNGQAFSDTDPWAGRGDFRTGNPVDTFIIDNSGASGGVLLGRTRDGEFTQYTVEVAEADEFEVRLSLASGHPDPGVIHVDVDGERVGTVAGGTNRWFDWTTRSAGTVTLEPGSHVVQLTWDQGAQINLDWLEVVSTTSIPAQCPSGTLEAEGAMLSGKFETGESSTASGGKYAHVPRGAGGWWNGESDSYVEFCASVDSADDYRIDARVLAASVKKRSFYVSVDGGPLVDFVAQTTVGQFETTAVNDAASLDPLRAGEALDEIVDPVTWDLEPGDHTIRFYLRRDGAWLDRITLSPASGGPPVEPDRCVDCDAVLELLDAANITPPVGEPCDWTSFGGAVRVVCSDERPPTIVELTLKRRLTEIPPEIGNLTNLLFLNISNNQLTNLPPEIGNLTNLEYLTARNNQIASLPPEIGNLTNLEYVDLYNNALTDLPAEFGNLTNLRWFQFYDNELTSLRPEIANLTNLTFINLGSNELTEVPSWIGNFTELTDLSIESNNLIELPPELGNLSNLETFYLDNNQLTEVPSWIGDLPDLRRLNISGNRIVELGPEITNFTNLTQINISGNRLRELPPEIATLVDLDYLDLRRNRLRGDITVLAPIADTWIIVGDGAGGNDCLTTTDQALADSLSSDWNLCENP